MRKAIFAICLLCLNTSCSVHNTSLRQNQISQETLETRARRPSAVERGKFLERDGEKLLYGGEMEKQHFNINDLELKPENFHYGIGRERFPALINPEFLSLEGAKQFFADSMRFLLCHIGNSYKAYSIKDLTRHEVVNDKIEGKPVMAAYCILADLGAMYDRTFGDKEFTFALSGYTYYDDNVWNGMDGFVMWDRETESLWWPLIGKSVCGPMKSIKMKVLDEMFWEQTTFGEIKSKTPKALILKPGQDFERPQGWIEYENVEDIRKKEEQLERTGLAPKWGENSK